MDLHWSSDISTLNETRKWEGLKTKQKRPPQTIREGQDFKRI